MRYWYQILIFYITTTFSHLFVCAYLSKLTMMMKSSRSLHRVLFSTSASSTSPTRSSVSSTSSTLSQLPSNLKPPERLLDLISLFQTTSTNTVSHIACDICCDHGLLALTLAHSPLLHFDKVYAIDVSANALSNARNNLNLISEFIAKSGHILQRTRTEVVTILGSGIEPLIDENTNYHVFIAGVGWRTVVDILKPLPHSLSPALNNNDDDNTNTNANLNTNTGKMKFPTIPTMIISPASPSPRCLYIVNDFLRGKGYWVTGVTICNGKKSGISGGFHIGLMFERSGTEMTNGNYLNAGGEGLSKRHDPNAKPINRKTAYEFVGKLADKLIDTDKNGEQVDIWNDYLDHHRDWSEKDDSISFRQRDVLRKA